MLASLEGAREEHVKGIERKTSEVNSGVGRPGGVDRASSSGAIGSSSNPMSCSVMRTFDLGSRLGYVTKSEVMKGSSSCLVKSQLVISNGPN